MMSALEKAKALKEFRQLRAKFGVLVMSPLEKAKALKRFRELRGMLGGDQQNSGAANLIKPVSEAIEKLVMIRIAERDDGAEMHDTKYINKINEVISFLKKSGDDAAISQITDMIAVAEKENGVSLLGGDGGAAQNEEPTAFTHAGFNVYPMRMRDRDTGEVTVKWIVQSIDNRDREMRGERQVGGDDILGSRDEAMKTAEFQERKAAGIAARNAAASAASSAKAIAEANKLQEYSDIGDVEGETALARGRRVAALSGKIRFRGDEITKKQMVDVLVAEGAKTSTEQEDRIKPMSRLAFHRATQREQDAHAEKVKNGGKITVYYLGDFRVEKIQYDYANHLISRIGGGQQEAGRAQVPAIDTSLLDGIISGQIDTFKDRAKLQELSDALAKAGGDDMPSGEVRDLFENAIRAAGKQVLTGFGYLDAEAA